MAPGPAGWLALSAKLKEQRCQHSLHGVGTVVSTSSVRLRETLAVTFAYCRHFVCFYKEVFDAELCASVCIILCCVR